MIFSREYVHYFARQIVQKLIETKHLELDPKSVPAVVERLNAALLEELGVEDRINEEVRFILEQYQDEMRKTGASYQELFKKVKSELARKYKAVL